MNTYPRRSIRRWRVFAAAAVVNFGICTYTTAVATSSLLRLADVICVVLNALYVAFAVHQIWKLRRWM